MKAFQFLKDLHHQQCHFQTREGKKVGEASNTELLRWFKSGSVIINKTKANWDDEIIFPIQSFVLFPKHPVTLWEV